QCASSLESNSGQNKTVIHEKIRAYLATEPYITRLYQRIMRPSLVNSNLVSISMLSSLQLSINTHVTAKNATAQNDAIAKIQEATQLIFIGEHKRYQHPVKCGRPPTKASPCNKSNLQVAEDVAVLIEYREDLIEQITTCTREVQSDVE
ncbi:8770_t:CDS:2, partial [Gigaspora rosea]